MKVLVYPHVLSVGGSQLNAIECAAAVRDLGNEVAVFGLPGPLTGHLASLGLPFIPAPEPRRRPDVRVAAALAAAARRERADLVHAYEWPPALEAYYGPQLAGGVPVLCTIMSMAVAPFLPPSMPLLVGTRLLQQRTAARRRGSVELLEPPVDTDRDHPGLGPSGFRHDHGLDGGEPLVVIVSRLAVTLKLEGLERSIAAAGQLADELPLRLAIVGGGAAAGRVAALAAAANQRAGRPVVVLTGELLDPRPAYAAADVVMGMGSSILRGLAFAKAAIVLGEQGFSEILSPESSGQFLWRGFYGVGPGDLGVERLAAQLRGLLGDEARRRELGRFSRELVCSRFALRAAGQRLAHIYQRVATTAPARPRLAVEGATSGARVVAYKARRRLQRARGGAVAADDFNARPVQ